MRVSLSPALDELFYTSLKKYVTEGHALVKELYINLGDLKAVRILSYYPGTEGIISRELKWSLTSPVQNPDATIYLWNETGFEDLFKRLTGVSLELNPSDKGWLEFQRHGNRGQLYPIATIDLSGEWGMHYTSGNEFFYGVDGLAPESWFKEGHLFVQAFFRILNQPTTSLVHGACVGVDGKGILVCARGGMGKSTLSVMAMLRGFEYVSDDYLILSDSNQSLEASPIYSFITLSPKMYDSMYDDLDRARFLGVSPWRGKYVLDISGYEDRFRSHYPVKALVFPEITPGLSEPHIAKCSAAEKGKAIVQIAHSTISQMSLSGLRGTQRDMDFIQKIIKALGKLDCFKIALSPDLEANVACLESFIKTIV